MGVLFESILLFSLAVLIILVGLLVYYFKKRIVDVEQKNTRCFEIVHDICLQQIKMKNEVYSILFPVPKQDDRIKIELSEDEEESELDDEESVKAEESVEESDEESEEESDDDDESEEEKEDSKIKIVNVDMSFPEECEINIDEDEFDDDIDESEPELKSMASTEPIVVSKLDTNYVTPVAKSNSKDELKKMTPSSLKSLIISKGISAESINKMKKPELIDLLVTLV
jgi:hypothetical protein